MVANRRIRANVNCDSFISKILTTNELKQFNNLNEEQQVYYLAGRFASKEAYLKAIGTGCSQGNNFKSIEIISDESGKPLLSQPGHVSISHEKENTIAIVILED